MNKKRGLSEPLIIALIFMVIILGVLLLLNSKINQLHKDYSEEFACKSSVQAQDKLTFKNIFLGNEIKCPTKEIEISSKDPEIIKRIFAQELYSLCDEFNRGEVDLFGNKETKFCVIRNIIKFKEKSQIIEGLAKYLEEENIPGTDEKYKDYCRPYITERIDEIYKDLNPELNIQFRDEPVDTNKDYAIIFYYAKGEEEFRELLKLAFGTSPAHLTQYGGVLISIGSVKLKGIKTIITVGMGGSAIAEWGFIWNYFTNPDLKKEWASFFVIREYSAEELEGLGCKYLPAEQK